MKNCIETFDLTKKFARSKGFKDLLFASLRNREVTAVDNVSLCIQEGEAFALLGPNGAGKTTLIKMLCTLVLPTSGSAQVLGWDVVKEEKEVKRKVGLINSEERSFYWRLSGRQNLEFFAAIHNLSRREVRRKVDDLLELVELSDKAEVRYQNYSTGMRQRLAIARGLLSDPQILFMDEPTRSLDPVSAQSLRGLIKEGLVREMGKTVVLVTHMLEEAEELCHRIAIMDRGRVIASGTPAQVKAFVPKQEVYTLEVKGMGESQLRRLGGLPGVRSLSIQPANPHGVFLEVTMADEESVLPGVVEFIVGEGGRICRCDRREISLEDAFMYLVKERNGEPNPV